MARMTRKKRLFVNGVLSGLNPTESAAQAGYSYPRQSAHHLLQDKQIRFYLDKHITLPATAQIKEKATKQAFQIPELELKRIFNNDDSLEVLLGLMNCNELDIKIRLDIAAFLLPYFHAKKPPVSEKEARQRAANLWF